MAKRSERCIGRTGDADMQQVTFEAWLSNTGVCCPTCSLDHAANPVPYLSLNHLTRAQLWLLCAHEGISVKKSNRTELLRTVHDHLASQLDHDWLVSALPGTSTVMSSQSTGNQPELFIKTEK